MSRSMSFAGIFLLFPAALMAVAASSPESVMNQKAIVVDVNGVYFGVQENVRLEETNGQSFVVVPRNPGKRDQASYEYWVPMNRVDGLRVYESREDAIEYQKERSTVRKKSADRFILE